MVSRSRAAGSIAAAAVGVFRCRNANRHLPQWERRSRWRPGATGTAWPWRCSSGSWSSGWWGKTNKNTPPRVCCCVPPTTVGLGRENEGMMYKWMNEWLSGDIGREVCASSSEGRSLKGLRLHLTCQAKLLFFFRSLSLSLSFSVCVCLSVCTCYISTTYIQTGKNTHPLLNHLMKFVLLHQSKTFLHYYLWNRKCVSRALYTALLFHTKYEQLWNKFSCCVVAHVLFYSVVKTFSKHNICTYYKIMIPAVIDVPFTHL